nr:MAG TPA: hypothetical protein [Caudoviricetes sp.]
MVSMACSCLSGSSFVISGRSLSSPREKPVLY